MPDAQFPTPAPYTIAHQWPWRRQEFTTMAVVSGLAFGLCSLFIPEPFGYPAGAAAVLGTLIWLYRVKRSRVTISCAEVTIDGTHLTVRSKGLLAVTFVDTTKVTTIAVRRFGSDECFMLSDGTGGARLPLRVTGDPVVRAALDHAWDNATQRTAEAVELRDRMLAGHLPG